MEGSPQSDIIDIHYAGWGWGGGGVEFLPRT